MKYRVDELFGATLTLALFVGSVTVLLTVAVGLF